MALKDLLALVDDKLRPVYETVAYNPTSDRTKMVKRIDATKSKFLSTEPAKGKKDLSVSNNTVRYTPTVNGKPVTLDGRTELYIPSERFGDFLDGLKREVESGSLDKEIEAAVHSDGETAQPTTRKPRQKSEGGSGRGWSEERKAKFAKTIAARKAAAQG